jgi:hypothetical protein
LFYAQLLPEQTATLDEDILLKSLELERKVR